MVKTIEKFQGVLISIAFWEIMNFFSQSRRESQKNILEQKAAESYLNYLALMQDHQPSERQYTQYQAYLQAAAIISVKEQEYNKRYSKTGAPRQLILNVGSAFFGTLVGLLALLNNDYINGLRVIDFNATVVLLGIGLGIGSLKEFVDKASS
jgi:hypothetical protein